MLISQRNLPGDEKVKDTFGPTYLGSMRTLWIAADSVCSSVVASKVVACHHPDYACHSVTSSPGSDFCSACKSKWGDHDCKSSHFSPNLPTFSNINLSSFKYSPKDVEHWWTRCSYMRELQVFSLAKAQTRLSSRHLLWSTPVPHAGRWQVSLAEVLLRLQSPHCTCSNEPPIQLLRIPSYKALAPQKPQDVCFTPSDLHSAPSRYECQPFPWESAKGGLLGPFSIVCGVCFAPPHTVFQMFSRAEASSACSSYQKPKSCLSLSALICYSTVTLIINHEINPWVNNP